MQALPQDKKKLIVSGVIIGVCIVGAVVAYTMLSGSGGGDVQAQSAAEKRLEEIQASQAAQATPEPKPIERTPTKGAVNPAGTK